MGGGGSKCIGERDSEVIGQQNGIHSFTEKVSSMPFSNNRPISTVPDIKANKSIIYNQLKKEKSPMPDSTELEKRFNKILASMDLPPDKAKLLRQYDDVKKWEMIRDQERVTAKEPPSHYLNKLRTYLDPKASRSSRKRRMVGETTSTNVLSDLEISLRTNHIEWVQEFLSDDNQGLDVIINYLYFRLLMLRQEQKIRDSQEEDESLKSNGTLLRFNPEHQSSSSPRMKKMCRHIQKLNMGDIKDDIHLCIMCLRAIMNNKYGFSLIFQHKEAINCIALSLNHHSLRTKALVLELLAAICLVKGGHDNILHAFDNFKDICLENKRFSTLMDYFINYEFFHIEFMVACMQFINIVVHSVEDMNFRVHLQYEFSQHNVDEYLEKLRHHESEELQVQISAYLDNVFDVAALMEDSEIKTSALETVAELEDLLAQAQERMAEMESSFAVKFVDLEGELIASKQQTKALEEVHNVVQEEVTTLRKAASMKEEESRERQSLLEKHINELETMKRTSGGSTELLPSVGVVSPPSSTMASPPPPPPPPPPPMLGGSRAPAPPPPPRLPLGRGAPHFPGMPGSPMDAMTIKKKYTTKYKLPTLNWVALKPNQVRGTVFNDLDDEKLHRLINFDAFEELFKIGNAGGSRANGDSDVDSLQAFGSKRFKRPELTSLMEHTRLRNIAISRRKLEYSVEVVTHAINSQDLKTLNPDSVELLQRMVPNEAEIKAYREYERDRKLLSQLTEEDRYMLHLSKIDRVATKLQVMSFVANFSENIQIVSPQVHSILVASSSVKNSIKFRKFLEVVLAFGNYMNSGRRGPAYGFKMSSLDNICDTKASDKKTNLLHFIQNTIEAKMPDLKNWDTELRCTEKASQVSLENILTDMNELEKGMDQTRKEYCHAKDMRSPEGHYASGVLREFLSASEDKLKKLKAEVKAAQDSFGEVLDFFGENLRSMPPHTFFAIIARLLKAYKTVEQENAEQKKRQETALRQAALNLLQADKQKQNNIRNSKVNSKNNQEALISEMKARGVVADKRLLSQEDVYHGALEDILSGLKNEPYRRADAVRRSQRKHNDNVRLSRTMDEMEF